MFNRIFKLSHHNEFESIRIREFYKKKYNIEIGLYSYGCFDVNRIARNTIIGRYCSFAPTSYIYNANHPVERVSMHPYFYNPALKFVSQENIKRVSIIIGDDAWLGHNSVVLPSAETVGRGAVIGAGTVVTKSVPPYAIVCGNPGRIIKFRFTDEQIHLIEESKWWENDVETAAKIIESINMKIDK